MIKQFYIFFLIILPTIQVTGQNSTKLSTADSVLMEQTWAKYSKFLIDRDEEKIKKNSLQFIHCMPCSSDEAHAANYVVPVDAFINSFYDFSKGSKLETLIKSDEKNIYRLSYKDYQPGNLPLESGKLLMSYEVFFLTFKPNELCPGHEGGGHIFKFIKKEDRFVLYSFDTNP